MRIAVLSSHTPSLFWFRMDMMKAFQKCGHEVVAVANEPEDQWREKFAEHGIVYRQIQVQRNGTNPVKDLKTLSSIKAVLREVRPDKIFTFQAKTVIYGGIAANQLGITEVYPLIAGMGSVFLKDDFKTRVIRTILKTEYRMAMRKCPTVFFQNHDDEAIFRKYHIIGKQKIAMMRGSGVNLEKFCVQPLPEKFGFLCISRLIRDKGVGEYLEACKRLKEKYSELRCLLVGPFDSNPSALRHEELQPFLDAGVEYYGEQTDVRPYLAQCNVFVLPSYREGTPKTVLEAMASGRAVLTTDAPGCRETVKQGINGYMVPVRDINALTEKMEELYLHPELICQMGIEGRRMAEEIFDVNSVNRFVCETMGLYEAETILK